MATNVPNEVRSLWTDVYKVFDKHYQMDISDEKAWTAFWGDVIPLWEKYGKTDEITRLLTVVGELIVFYRKSGK